MGNIVTCMARCVKCSDVYFHEMLWGKKKWERARTYTYIDDYIYIYDIIYLYIPHTYSLHYDTKRWFYLTQHQAQLIQVSVTFQKRFSRETLCQKDASPDLVSLIAHGPHVCLQDQIGHSGLQKGDQLAALWDATYGMRRMQLSARAELISASNTHKMYCIKTCNVQTRPT